jgi:hypothetical protein
MTPKQKAEELVDKFHIKVHVSFVENSIPSVVNALMLYDSAKQCALIAVDEIINTLLYGYNLIEYWKEVKKEIELL